MTVFRHLYGIGGRFILLQGRGHWLPLNDPDWQQTTLPGDFLFEDEAFYATDSECIATQLPDNVKIFSEEARALEQKRLETLALQELAKDLRAARAEEDLMRLLDRLDRHLQRDDWFD